MWELNVPPVRSFFFPMLVASDTLICMSFQKTGHSLYIHEQTGNYSLCSLFIRQCSSVPWKWEASATGHAPVEVSGVANECLKDDRTLAERHLNVWEKLEDEGGGNIFAA